MQWCSQLGVTTVALTDHDSVAGVTEACEAADAYHIRNIPALEVSTSGIKGYCDSIDLMGYEVDITSPDLSTLLTSQAYAKRMWWDEILRAVSGMGLQTPTPQQITNRTILCQEVVSNPVNTHRLRELGLYAWKDLRTTIAPIQIQLVSLDEAVHVISRCGGKSVLSSDSVTQTDNLPKLLFHLKKLGLTGLECFHPQRTRQESTLLLDAARYHKLLITGSSDYHDSPRSNNDPKHPGDWEDYGYFSTSPTPFNSI
jgi:predicted metal-dependent phosphoesterase TrpH